MNGPHPSFSAATTSAPPAERFQPTRWSLVRQAAGSNPVVAHKALGELCRIYWYPLYAFVRRSGWSPDDARDHTQEFFARLIERGDFAKADPSLGKLRSYLLGAMKNHLTNEREKARAIRRGGGVLPVSIDQAQAEQRYAMEPADELTPDKLYDRRWAMTLLALAMQSLRADYEGRGKQAEFEALLPFLSWNSGEDYERAGAMLDLSAGAIRVAVHRLRQRMRDAMISQIAETVETGEQAQDELRLLFAVFS